MGRKDEELLKKLLPMFEIEARDHLKVISSGLIEVERSEPEKQARIIETVYREAHSLKGAARSVNFSSVVAICQAMETVFSALKGKDIPLSSDMLDLLHNAVDCTSGLVAGEDLKSTVGELVQRLEELARTGAVAQKRFAGQPGKTAAGRSEESNEALPLVTPPAEQEPKTPTYSASDDTVRISTRRLDSLFLQAEEMLSVKIASVRLAGELKGLGKVLAQWKKERTRRKSRITGTSFERQKPESETEDGVDSFIALLESRLNSLVKSAEYDQRTFGTMVDNLLDYTKKTLMLPLGSIFEMIPRLVRDLSKEAGKEVEFTTSGGEIELDRRVLEQIKDPIIHLVRNCIDHGIETPSRRERENKPPCGKIRIAGNSRDNKIEIVVYDDGAGIDVSKVKIAAQQSGAISMEEAEKLDEKETLSLVFRSGISTSPIITDLSGRGLGLAIVRERVEKLGGAVAIETLPGIGTTIAMVVPVSIATFRGVLVRVGDHLFVIPSANVEKVSRARKEEIQTVENIETLTFEGRPVSLVKLGSVLELNTTSVRAGAQDPCVQVVVIGSAGKRIAFHVDEVIQEQEVLVKNLGPQMSRVRNIAGATLLGGGKIVPILNVSDLMISAGKAAPIAARAVSAAPLKREAILVVEDSITSRALLKTILESAGYDVVTAVDGIDALTALKTREFDLVVSDIEMPRMDGFDLTARIRSDRKFSDLPVVLVTALESRENKERGIDVGANAYIVKSSFEQSNLLEVIRRLL
jgi:two-component system chemotaxis sensor kinase CheA